MFSSDDLVRGSSSIWTLYARQGCAHSGLTRTSLRATFSRCASRSSMARCSPELRKNTAPLDASPRRSGLIVHRAWQMLQSRVFVARGLAPTRRVVTAKLASAAVIAERTLLRSLHVGSFREGVLAEVRRTPLGRSSQYPIFLGTWWMTKCKNRESLCSRGR
jgi:hypothetical protein